MKNCVNLKVLLLIMIVIISISCNCGSDSPTEPGTDNREIPDISFISLYGGSFQMGDEDNKREDFVPVHTVTLDEFAISTTEITNAQYCKYLNSAFASGDIAVINDAIEGASGEYKHKLFIYLGRFSSKYPQNACWIHFIGENFTVEPGKENWPIVYITWYGAKAFALFYGFDLPTEAEWEYAARGGKQHRYGTDDGRINKFKVNAVLWSPEIFHPVDVGSYPSNPFGLFDMSGNVEEWCNDWYDINYYKISPEQNPTGPISGTERVVRGGSYSNTEWCCRSAFRCYYPPTIGLNDRGFRVVHRPGTVTY